MELIVHRNTIKKLPDYEMMILSIADEDNLTEQIPIKKLPADWRSFKSYFKLQEIGSAKYKKQSSLVLKVPSAVVPKEYNYIINTKHPTFNRNVLLVRNEEYFFDERLFE